MGKKEDELMDIVDKIFADFEKDKKEVQEKQNEEVSQDDFNRALKYANKELEEMYEAYIKFRKKIEGLKIKDFVAEELIQFGGKCEFVETIVKGEFKQGKSGPKAQKEYQKLQKLRAKILADIYDYYEKDMPF